MSQGFHVFFASSLSIPFDLVAYKDGRFHKVETKSLNLASNCPSFGWPKGEWDMLIVVADDKRCFSFVREPASNYYDCIDSIRRDLDLPPVHRPSGVPLV